MPAWLGRMRASMSIWPNACRRTWRQLRHHFRDPQRELLLPHRAVRGRCRRSQRADPSRRLLAS
eukprot:1628788-Alexandrium_andersonii.AAC.1